MDDTDSDYPYIEEPIPPGTPDGTRDNVGTTTPTEESPRQPGTETDDEEALSDRDILLAQALGAGHSQASAAELVGVSAKTVKRRLDDPGFAAAVGRARQSFMDQTLGRLSQASIEATETLVEVMHSGRAADRVRAAEAVLSHTGRLSRQLADEDLKRRLDRLEAIMREEGQQATGRPTSSGNP